MWITTGSLGRIDEKPKPIIKNPGDYYTVIVAAWQKCIYCLKNELPSQQFNTWIRPLKFINGNNVLYLLAPNKFVLEWVKDHFLARIEAIIEENAEGDAPKVVLEIVNGDRLPADLSLSQALNERTAEKDVDQVRPGGSVFSQGCLANGRLSKLPAPG